MAVVSISRVKKSDLERLGSPTSCVLAHFSSSVKAQVFHILFSLGRRFCPPSRAWCWSFVYSPICLFICFACFFSAVLLPLLSPCHRTGQVEYPALTWHIHSDDPGNLGVLSRKGCYKKEGESKKRGREPEWLRGRDFLQNHIWVLAAVFFFGPRRRQPSNAEVFSCPNHPSLWFSFGLKSSLSWSGLLVFLFFSFLLPYFVHPAFPPLPQPSILFVMSSAPALSSLTPSLFLLLLCSLRLLLLESPPRSLPLCC